MTQLGPPIKPRLANPYWLATAAPMRARTSTADDDRPIMRASFVDDEPKSFANSELMNFMMTPPSLETPPAESEPLRSLRPAPSPSPRTAEHHPTQPGRFRARAFRNTKTLSKPQLAAATGTPPVRR